ncbi:unnamed protein product [Eruca vesicaria subsp. sativa]|uniref:Uncharacterized protein n=1 Tax=Eruca vesicaria subsp. sativa TaxID=29727 RepID=A0ABC8KWK7_ERUVS|nr:unnamed protein product [Eruca vesicaria subsp. sativa]
MDTKHSPETVETISIRKRKLITTAWGEVVEVCSDGEGMVSRLDGGSKIRSSGEDLKPCGGLEKNWEEGFERSWRNKVVGKGQDTAPDVEDETTLQSERRGASDGVEGPTPAAKGLTGVEKNCLRWRLENRVWELFLG